MEERTGHRWPKPDDMHNSQIVSGSEKALSEEAVNIQTIASLVHVIDVKKKLGQKNLQKIMPELCEEVIEGKKRVDV